LLIIHEGKSDRRAVSRVLLVAWASCCAGWRSGRRAAAPPLAGRP